MIYPTVHVNGTSQKELLAQHLNAVSVLDVAIAALRTVTPDRRDYAPQDDPGRTDVADAALRDHRHREGRLSSVRAEINAIAEKIAEQRL